MRHTGLSYKHTKQVVLLYISILSPHFAHSSFLAISGWSLLPIGIGWSLLSNWHRVFELSSGSCVKGMVSNRIVALFTVFLGGHELKYELPLHSFVPMFVSLHTLSGDVYI